DDLITFGGDDLVNLGGDDLVVYAGDDLVVFGGDDDLINLGGDDLISFGGDDLVSFGGDDLIVLAGDLQPAPTYAGAKGLGRTAPHGVRACIAGTPGCFETVQPFTPQFHRNVVSWQTLAIVGHIDPVLGYQVQAKRADVPNSTFADVGSTTANFLIDNTVWPNKLPVTYRVRAHFDDGPPAMSAWEYLRAPIEARNDLPDPRADSYVVPNNAGNSLTVPAPGVLGVSC